MPCHNHISELNEDFFNTAHWAILSALPELLKFLSIPEFQSLSIYTGSKKTHLCLQKSLV
uniref:Uncharacterized protein n=1 Tax=Arion vulgaris TaxID=1028688 RepID=A0A0B6ZKS4_9EUPU